MKLSILLLLLLPHFCSAQSQDPCNAITKITDEYTDKVHYVSADIDFTKVLKYVTKLDTTYYLSLQAFGYSITVGEEGVHILFEDGTKWNRNDEKIDCDVDGIGFDYRSFTRLSSEDLELFSRSPIKKFKLYIYEQELNKKRAIWFMHYVQCIQHVW